MNVPSGADRLPGNPAQRRRRGSVVSTIYPASPVRPLDGERHRTRVAASSDAPIVECDSGESELLIPAAGVLEMHPKGYAFLRDLKNNCLQTPGDVFVSPVMIDDFSLRAGVLIRGLAQPQRDAQGARLKRILDIDGIEPERYKDVRHFDSLTAINPESWLKLETGAEPLGTRVVDLLTPLGKGQRALIVAPPRTGKTILLQQIGQAIATNYPDVKLIVLLIDERPEEVTDMRRSVNGEVVASSLDRDVESHVRLSQLIVKRAQRLAELGNDVFVIMDSITRMARAFNKWVGNTGRTDERRRRHQGDGHPQKTVRHRAAVRGRGFADHRCDRADRHRQPHG